MVSERLIQAGVRANVLSKALQNAQRTRPPRAARPRLAQSLEDREEAELARIVVLEKEGEITAAGRKAITTDRRAPAPQSDASCARLSFYPINLCFGGFARWLHPNLVTASGGLDLADQCGNRVEVAN
jgi:hypothetical protein